MKAATDNPYKQKVDERLQRLQADFKDEESIRQAVEQWALLPGIRPIPIPTPVQRWVRRRKWTAIGGVAGAVVILLGPSLLPRSWVPSLLGKWKLRIPLSLTFGAIAAWNLLWLMPGNNIFDPHVDPDRTHLLNDLKRYGLKKMEVYSRYRHAEYSPYQTVSPSGEVVPIGIEGIVRHWLLDMVEFASKEAKHRIRNYYVFFKLAKCWQKLQRMYNDQAAQTTERSDLKKLEQADKARILQQRRLVITFMNYKRKGPSAFTEVGAT